MVVQSRVLSVGEHKEDDMDKELREGMQLLYCKWCPQDCQGLTKEEKLGCLASGGYVDDELPILHSQGVVFPEYDDEERTKIARSNAIGMGLIDD